MPSSARTYPATLTPSTRSAWARFTSATGRGHANRAADRTRRSPPRIRRIVRYPARVASETVVITPSRGWQPLRLRLLWSFRELAYFLVWRDLKLRYKQ